MDRQEIKREGGQLSSYDQGYPKRSDDIAEENMVVKGGQAKWCWAKEWRSWSVSEEGERYKQRVSVLIPGGGNDNLNDRREVFC